MPLGTATRQRSCPELINHDFDRILRRTAFSHSTANAALELRGDQALDAEQKSGTLDWDLEDCHDCWGSLDLKRATVATRNVGGFPRRAAVEVINPWEYSP